MDSARVLKVLALAEQAAAPESEPIAPRQNAGWEEGEGKINSARRRKFLHFCGLLCTMVFVS